MIVLNFLFGQYNNIY